MNGMGTGDLASIYANQSTQTGAGFSDAQIFGGAGAAVSIINTIGSVYVAKKNAQMRRDRARFNAKVAKIQAEDKIDRIRRTQQRFEGSQIAAVGASGLSMDGSAIEVIADSMQEFELDIMAVNKDLAFSQAGYRIDQVQANADSGQASAAGLMSLANTITTYGQSLSKG